MLMEHFLKEKKEILFYWGNEKNIMLSKYSYQQLKMPQDYHHENHHQEQPTSHNNADINHKNA